MRLIPAQYVKPFLKGHKNDYRDAEAIAEAVQRPTMNFVAIKTPEQMDLLALHRVRSRLVSQRTGVINQIRGFLIERGITVRQGVAPLHRALPDILSSRPEALSRRMVSLIADLMQDWRRLDERIEVVSNEIEALAQQDDNCQRLMTVPGVGPIISSAMVAAIGNGAGFKQGRISAPGSASCRSKSRREIAPSLAESQARQQIPENSFRAGCTRRSSAAAEHGHARFVALDRASIKAPSPQHAGDRARQQTRPHRLGSSRPRSCLPGPGSPRMRDESSLGSTKRMPATLLRHRHSPAVMSERRWLREGMAPADP